MDNPNNPMAAEPSPGMSLLMAMPEKEPEESGSSMPEIPLPKGFTLPEMTSEGESFDFTCRGYVKDGMICIEKVNGVGTSEEEESEPTEEEMSETDVEEETPSSEEEMTIDSAIAQTRNR